MGLKFTGSEKSNTTNHSLQLFINSKNEIYIGISIDDDEDPFSGCFICLDRQTAIQVAKTLRREISYLEKEGEDG